MDQMGDWVTGMTKTIRMSRMTGMAVVTKMR